MIRQYQTERRGAVLPLVVICLIVLFGFVALTVDLGMMAIARNQAQNAADSAATAGARAFNGDPAQGYGYTSVPGKAIAAAISNKVLNSPVQGDPSITVTTAATSYTSGQVTVDMGAYGYYYSDDVMPAGVTAPAQESFRLDIPRLRATDPWSAVRATIAINNNRTNFASIFGISAFNTSATATAVHRPRDVVIIMDLSGSMRFQSLPGVPYDTSVNQARPSANNWARTRSMNPETVYPLFGHYADTAGAALYGNSSYPTTTYEYVDPANFSTATNGGPCLLDDFYKNPVGTALTVGNASTYKAFSRRPDSQATTPGGDDFLKTSLDGSTT